MKLLWLVKEESKARKALLFLLPLSLQRLIDAASLDALRPLKLRYVE
jgi:hypothetical protein